MLETVVNNPDRKIAEIDHGPDPRVRSERAARAFWDLYQVVQEEARQAGIPIDGTSALCRMHSAGLHFAEVWQVRANRLDRTLRMILASDFINDEQRSRVAAVLFGKQKLGRDSHTLNEYELQLIHNYRAADGAGKQMLRTMARLAASNCEPEGGAQ